MEYRTPADGDDPSNVSRYEELDDAALVAAMQKGDSRAWWEYNRRYARRILSFIKGQLSDASAEDHEDVLQVTMVKISHGIEKYGHRGGKSLVSWSLTIAQRACLDERRTRKRKGIPRTKQLIPFDEVEARYLGGPAQTPDAILASTTHEQNDSPSEEELVFRKAFESLSSIDQVVLQMTFYSDKPDEEIAKMIGKPAASVRQIRYKAKDRLKRACERIAAGGKR